MELEITNINQLDFDKSYTFADYLTWKFQERIELIKGLILKIFPFIQITKKLFCWAICPYSEPVVALLTLWTRLVLRGSF